MGNCGYGQHDSGRPGNRGGSPLNQYSRPFVTAGVLRNKFTINWNKDRGKNADGSERINDRHFTIAEKQAARKVTQI